MLYCLLGSRQGEGLTASYRTSVLGDAWMAVHLQRFSWAGMLLRTLCRCRMTRSSPAVPMLTVCIRDPDVNSFIPAGDGRDCAAHRTRHGVGGLPLPRCAVANACHAVIFCTCR
jgi:hypothetical protein